jgi:hypothetical protein
MSEHKYHDTCIDRWILKETEENPDEDEDADEMEEQDEVLEEKNSEMNRRQKCLTCGKKVY